MTALPMLGKDFRSLAEAVTGTYGDNPWFFLRELAQNSRDAGAENIQVETAGTAAGLEILTFADDGRGMDFDHARRFLFRLYASDKAGDKMSAGKYGIGFWTILGFQPATIVLASRTKKSSWAVVMNADLEVRPVECPLSGPGTTIILTRPAVFSTAAEFNRTVDSELRAYCQYLRRNDRRGTRLPVYFLGQNVTIPISLSGPLSYSFHNGTVEGAVGIAAKPLVRLFARGLPVWEGALLGQMSHLQTHPPSQSAIGHGLAPVFLLNGNRLDVTFSRNLALENSALKELRKIAEKALQSLLADSMESAFPRKWHQRFRDRLRTILSRRWSIGWKLLPLVLLVILPLEIMLLNHFFPTRATRGSEFFSLRRDSLNYPGAMVGLSFSEPALLFTYFPPAPCWFKVFVAADYDMQAGFIRQADGFKPAQLPFQPCESGKAINMQLTIEASGPVLLPLPSGHAIDPTSLFFNKGRQLPLAVNAQGESSVEIPARPGTIAYRACPGNWEQQMDVGEISRMTLLPESLLLPESMAGLLIQARSLTAAEKVTRADALVRSLLSYDTSTQTAQAFQRLPAGQPWLEKILAVGKGDCDVINGLNVLLLRKMGVPARLVIGLVGNNGRIQAGFHAWSEYFDNGWKITDASAGTVPTTLPLPGNLQSPLDGSDHRAASYPFSRPSSSALKGLVLPAAAMTALLLALIFLWQKKISRPRSSRSAASQSETGKELLLPVIQQALLQPELWGRESPLWNHPFLPVADGLPMAISRALALQRRGRLLFFTSRNPLVDALKGRGAPLIDLSQKLFSPLLSLLSGAVNLDLLYRLQPQPAPEGTNGTDDLLAVVNSCLGSKLKNKSICLLAPGLREADFLNISLPAAPSQENIFFPQRFIAVNPRAREFIALTALYKINRPLAVFRFLKTLNSESLLPVADPEAFLQKAARRLLRDYP